MNHGKKVFLQSLPNIINIMPSIPEDPSILFLPYAPHFHSWKILPHGVNDPIFKGLRVSVLQSLSQMPSPLITSSKSQIPFVPYGWNKGETIQKVTHAFLFLETEGALRRALEPPFLKVFHCEDSTFGYYPRERRHLWPWVSILDVLLESLLLLVNAYPNVVSFLYAEWSLLRITPS